VLQDTVDVMRARTLVKAKNARASSGARDKRRVLVVPISRRST